MVDFNALRAPFPPDRVSWRVGPTNADKTKGMALAYVDARDVADRLDEVCGPAGWQNRYPHANGKTVCEIGILVADGTDEYPQLNAQWIWKSDGAGDTDQEAEKGALSDAFKRAAVKWGIGRYLYDSDTPWVLIETAGPKSFKIKESEYDKLRARLTKQSPPQSGVVKGLDGSPGAGAAAGPGSPANPPAAPAVSPPKKTGSWLIRVPVGKNGAAEWPEWGKLVEDKISRAPTVPWLDKLWSDNAPALENCPDEVKRPLFAQYQNRRKSHQASAAA